MLRILTSSRDANDEEKEEQLRMARAGSKALFSLSKSERNMELMRKKGLVPLMARLLKSVHEDVVIPIMGTCASCATLVRPTKHILKANKYSIICANAGKLSAGHYH